MGLKLRRCSIAAVFLALSGCGSARLAATHGPAQPASARPQSASELRQATFDPSFWHTDFARHSVPLTSILPGGPPPDGIPPIDHPRYVSIAQAARFLAPREPVIALAIRGQARAYPLEILLWHEIVNDTLGGVPISVNAETSRPFDYGGRLDPRLPPVERVESITVGADSVVLPFDALRTHPVTAVIVGGTPAVVLFDPGVLSPLDQLKMASSRAVGSAAAFDRRVHGRAFQFRPAGPGLMTDAQTGSRWDLTGRAIAGPLRGAQLRRLPDLNASGSQSPRSSRTRGSRR